MLLIGVGLHSGGKQARVQHRQKKPNWPTRAAGVARVGDALRRNCNLLGTLIGCISAAFTVKQPSNSSLVCAGSRVAPPLFEKAMQ